MNIPNALHVPDMPLHTHWTSHDLADAVPLRLSEMLDFEADRDIGTGQASANTMPSRHSRQPLDFVRNAALPFFRVR